MTEEQRAELEKLARAATPGEWTHDGGTGWMAPVLHQWTETGCCGQVLDSGECCGNSVSQDQEQWDVAQIGSASPEDAAFIAAANPATVLDLLATIARLEAERVKDGEALEKISEDGPDIGPVIKPTYTHGFDQGCAWAGRIARARLSSRAKDQSQ